MQLRICADTQMRNHADTKKEARRDAGPSLYLKRKEAAWRKAASVRGAPLLK